MASTTKHDNELLVWGDPKAKLQSKLGEFVQYFQIGIPVNDGIPKMYIDPTVLLPYLLSADNPDALTDDVIDMAKTTIDFSEGFPTVDGIPFWERLEGEPIPYYQTFKEFRELKYNSCNDKGVFTRSLAKLSENTDIPGRHLAALSKIYHWPARVKAYDKNKENERQLSRNRDVELLETKHAKISNQLLDQAVDYLINHPEQLNPKVAIDLATLAMKSGRLALGLHPDKPDDGGGSGGGGRNAVNINMVNNNANDGGQISQMNIQEGLSDIERKTADNSKDVGHLQSILHVLNASGAFAPAQEEKAAVEVVDAVYEVLPD